MEQNDKVIEYEFSVRLQRDELNQYIVEMVEINPNVKKLSEKISFV